MALFRDSLDSDTDFELHSAPLDHSKSGSTSSSLSSLPQINVSYSTPRKVNYTEPSPPSPPSPDSPPLSPQALAVQSHGPLVASTPKRPFRSFLRLNDAPTTPRSLFNSRLQVPLSIKKLVPAPDMKPSRVVAPPQERENENPFTPTAPRSAKKTLPKPSNLLPSTNFPVRLFEESTSAPLESPRKHRKVEGEGAVSRFRKEYRELGVLGGGEFGTVLKCKNRLDGITYAIKRSNNPIAGPVHEQRLLREVYAHAVLDVHPNIVRYYSAWEEENHMLIQNEFCDGGSLDKVLVSYRAQGRNFSEPELLHILKHIVLGLEALHSKDLVHMDVKPGNIFLKTDFVSTSKLSEDEKEHEISPMGDDSDDKVFEDSEAEDDGDDLSCMPSPRQRWAHTTYKLGDLGHVTKISDPVVEEGDSRYLPKEILEENYKHLPKADIFALGLSIYEAGSALPLPNNGPLWHQLRDGACPYLSRYSMELNHLIQGMIAPNPENRPSASQILKHPLFVVQHIPIEEKSSQQLRKELNAEKFEKARLLRELNEVKSRQGQPAPDRISFADRRRGSAPAFARTQSFS